MSADDHVAIAIDELPTLWDGFAKLVREGCGITAFGAQIMDLPADYSTRSHDETGTGQEELYVGMRGGGAVVIDASGERLTVDAEHIVRVGPSVARTLTSGPEGLRVLIIGGTPGQAYEVQEWTRGE